MASLMSLFLETPISRETWSSQSTRFCGVLRLMETCFFIPGPPRCRRLAVGIGIHTHRKFQGPERGGRSALPCIEDIL